MLLLGKLTKVETVSDENGNFKLTKYVKSSILCISLNVYVSAWHKLNNVYAYDIYAVKSPGNDGYLVIIFLKEVRQYAV